MSWTRKESDRPDSVGIFPQINFRFFFFFRDSFDLKYLKGKFPLEMLGQISVSWSFPAMGGMREIRAEPPDIHPDSLLRAAWLLKCCAITARAGPTPPDTIHLHAIPIQ